MQLVFPMLPFSGILPTQVWLHLKHLLPGTNLGTSLQGKLNGLTNLPVTAK